MRVHDGTGTLRNRTAACAVAGRPTAWWTRTSLTRRVKLCDTRLSAVASPTAHQRSAVDTRPRRQLVCASALQVRPRDATDLPADERSPSLPANRRNEIAAKLLCPQPNSAFRCPTPPLQPCASTHHGNVLRRVLRADEEPAYQLAQAAESNRELASMPHAMEATDRIDECHV